MIAHRPVVVFPFNRIRQWASLGMALNTGVTRSDVIHFRWIQNVFAGTVCYVLATRAMAAFAAYVPFGDLFGLDVVVDRVAPVAGRTGRALHVVGRIKRRPPIGSGLDEIGSHFLWTTSHWAGIGK